MKYRIIWRRKKDNLETESSAAPRPKPKRKKAIIISVILLLIAFIVIANLRSERDKAFIQSYRSQLIQSEARMKREQNNYGRQKQLYDSQLISQEQLETAKIQFDIAQAEVQAIRHQIQEAEASLKSTLASLSKTYYNSPIDGIIP